MVELDADAGNEIGQRLNCLCRFFANYLHWLTSQYRAGRSMHSRFAMATVLCKSR